MEKEDVGAQGESDEDELGPDLEDDSGIVMDVIDSIEQDPEETEQQENDQEEDDQEGAEESESPSFSGEPMEMDYQQIGTPPPPENERVEPWHFADLDKVWSWKAFCKEELFKNVKQVEDDLAQENVGSKRGRYKSTTTALDEILKSSCTRRFVEWRRRIGDGLSNVALDELLNILHDPDCNNGLLPRNHYQLEQLQDRALASFKPKTTRWRIPKEKNDAESEEIVVTDIEHLLRLQLQDPEVARSIIANYSYNDGIISHPSHGELWKKLAAYDAANRSFPLCLKVLI
jgi:hypothetical protein